MSARTIVMLDLDKTAIEFTRDWNEGLLQHLQALQAGKEHAQVSLFTAMSPLSEIQVKASDSENKSRKDMLVELEGSYGIRIYGIYQPGTFFFGDGSRAAFDAFFPYDSKNMLRGGVPGGRGFLRNEAGARIRMGTLLHNLEHLYKLSLLYQKTSVKNKAQRTAIEKIFNEQYANFVLNYEELVDFKAEDEKGKESQRLLDLLDTSVLRHTMSLLDNAMSLLQLSDGSARSRIDRVSDALVEHGAELDKNFRRLAVQGCWETVEACEEGVEQDGVDALFNIHTQKLVKGSEKLAMYLHLLREQHVVPEDTIVYYEDNPVIIAAVQALHADLGYPCHLVCIEVKRQDPKATYDALLKQAWAAVLTQDSQRTLDRSIALKNQLVENLRALEAQVKNFSGAVAQDLRAVILHLKAYRTHIKEGSAQFQHLVEVSGLLNNYYHYGHFRQDPSAKTFLTVALEKLSVMEKHITTVSGKSTSALSFLSSQARAQKAADKSAEQAAGFAQNLKKILDPVSSETASAKAVSKSTGVVRNPSSNMMSSALRCKLDAKKQLRDEDTSQSSQA